MTVVLVAPRSCFPTACHGWTDAGAEQSRCRSCSRSLAMFGVVRMLPSATGRWSPAREELARPRGRRGARAVRPRPARHPRAQPHGHHQEGRAGRAGSPRSTRSARRPRSPTSSGWRARRSQTSGPPCPGSARCHARRRAGVGPRGARRRGHPRRPAAARRATCPREYRRAVRLGAARGGDERRAAQRRDDAARRRARGHRSRSSTTAAGPAGTPSGRARRAGRRAARAAAARGRTVRAAGSRRVPADGGRRRRAAADAVACPAAGPRAGAVIRLLLADDQHLVRGALPRCCRLEADLEVVAEVGRGDEVVAAALRAPARRRAARRRDARHGRHRGGRGRCAAAARRAGCSS